MPSGESKKVKAIVTRAVRYGETDIILTLVSVEQGKLTATAKGCLKPKAKLRYAAELFNFGDYVLSGSNRLVVTECSQIESFLKITEDIEKYYAGMMVLELLEKLSAESQPQLFLNAIEHLKMLTDTESDADEVITSYMLQILKLNGIEFDYINCSVCGCIIEGDGIYTTRDGIVCRDCTQLNGIRLTKNVREYLAEQKKENVPTETKKNANYILNQIMYDVLGIRASKQYFMEQL